MQQGRGGMGTTKHGKSGRSPRSPRYKVMQTLEDNRIREQESRKKPKAKMYGSVAEAFQTAKGR